MRRPPNSELLRIAREARGYTLETLGKAVGVSPGLISKVERDNIQAKDELVQAIADELRFPSRLFYRTEHVRGTDSPCIHHRKRKTMPAKVLNRIEAQMHLTQLQVKRLVEDLDIETEVTFATLDPDEYGGAAKVAQALRGYWRVPEGPIANLVAVLEAAAAVIVLREFGTSKLDGMSSWAKGFPPLFFINSHIPIDRMRWTLAHELGHLVMHHTMTSGDQEDEADRFALEFLAPEAELKPGLRNLSLARLPALKMHWGLSMIALIRATKTLDVLPPGKQKSLYVQLSRNGWRTHEPHPLPEETPSTLQRAMQVHLTEHEYSKDDLAMVVDLYPDEFSALYKLPDETRLRAV